MTIMTKPYGEKELDERQIVAFDRGLLGFPERTRWALLDATQSSFYWLQSLDDPALAFLLIDPFTFRPDYELDLGIAEEREIDHPEPEDVLLFAIVTVPAETRNMTANLQGPVVINRKSRKGVQTILADSRWKTRHAIMDELAALRAGRR